MTGGPQWVAVELRSEDAVELLDVVRCCLLDQATSLARRSALVSLGAQLLRQLRAPR